jgi:diguanylate cyclase (GGDEF)-like protein
MPSPRMPIGNDELRTLRRAPVPGVSGGPRANALQIADVREMGRKTQRKYGLSGEGSGREAPARRSRHASGHMPCALARRTLAVVLLWVPLCLQGTERASAQTFSFQSFGQQQGLSDVGITAIAGSAGGRLWVGTQYGLFRFDGERFIHVRSVEPDESPFISAMYLDARHRLWFTDADGLFFRDSTGVHRVSGGKLGFGYGAPQIVSFPGASQAVYFAGGGRLRRAVPAAGGRVWRIEEVFTAVQKAALPELKDIHSVAVGRGQELWVGCGSAICEDVNGKVRLWSTKEGVNAAYWNNLFVDRAGKLWIRGDGHIFSLEPGAQMFHRDEKGLAPQALDAGDGAFVEDRDGRVITGLANGIALHGEHGWRSVTTKNGFPADIVNSLYVDGHGTLWMGVTGLGLVRWIGSEDWEGWTSSDGLSSNNIWSLARDRRGWLWVGTESNLELLKPGAHRFIQVRPADGKAITHVLTLLDMPDGRLWSGSGAGRLMVYNPENGQSSSLTFAKDIFHIFAGRAGRVWICSDDGVWSVAAASSRLVATPAGGPAAHKQIFDGAEDPSGALWFVGNRSVFRLDGHRWSTVPLAGNLRLNVFAQLAAASDGTLWVTTAGHGAVHMRYAGGRLNPIDDPIEQPAGEPREPQSASKNVVMLRLDSRGWLWAGTDNGVDVFNGSRWRHISHQDGLVWDDADSNAFLSDRDGSVWIGTSGGIAHIIHPDQIFAEAPLRVSLNGAMLGHSHLAAAQSTVLPWRKWPFTLRVSVSNLSRAQSVEYHYRLFGLDSEWTRTTEPEVRYPSLPPGKYRFEVFAVDAEVGSRTPVESLSFRILAPWWQRPWFIGLMILAGLGLLALLWRWRTRAILRHQHYLEKLVAARTRELAELAIRDSLTGLLNRAAIFDLLEKEIDRAHRGNGLLAIVLADLDHFKEVNDRYGHPVGDAVLAAFSRRVERILRVYDGFGRYGGEEFLILISGIEQIELLDRLEELRESIAAEPFLSNGHTLSLTCSFGITMLRPSDHSSAALIERVDAALYQAKRSGRNCVHCAEASRPQAAVQQMR